MNENRQIATSLESSLVELSKVIPYYPMEVLDTLEVTGPLLSLDNPALYERVCGLSMLHAVKIMKTTASMLHCRQEALYWAHLVLPTLQWSPVAGVTLSPLYAVEIAERFCDGIGTRKTLAWAARYCAAFRESSPTQGDFDYIMTCRGVCLSSREDLWRAIADSIKLLRPTKNDTRFESQEQLRALRSLRARKVKERQKK